MTTFRLLREIGFWPLAVVAAAGVAACGSGSSAESGGEAFEVVDSAGVEIVRNHVGDAGLSRLGRTEALRIGVREGPPELELYGVRDVVVGPDDEVFAALQNDGEIRVYDASGAWLRTIGREGAGPGEFRAITWVGIFGDTLLAYDPRLYRMTVFTLDGELLDTWPTRKGMATVIPHARSDAGWIATFDDFAARPEYGIGKPARNVSRIGVVASVPGAIDAIPEGSPPWAVHDVVVEHPAWTTWGIGEAGGAVFGRNPLWEARQQHAFDGRGRIFVSRGSEYAIDVFDETGALLRRVARTHEPVPITDALVDRYRDEVMAHYDTTSTTGEAGLDLVKAAEQHIGLPRSENLPVLGDIDVSKEGAIWVERPDLVADPLVSEWSRAGYQPEIRDIFDPDGRFVGTVEMPTRSTVHVVGTDWVIVTERDQLDVQYIVKYTIAF
jgi:hypothetical protein